MSDYPINLQCELVTFLRKKRMRKYKLPQVGVYYPTTLIQNCVRGQWNFYKMCISEGRFPDAFVLKTSEGNAWHEMLETLGVWDATEVSVKAPIKLGDGSRIWIRGRCDAIRGDTVYDFKRTEWVPYRKPKFDHLLQLNFYMEALGKPKGVLAYIGYHNGNFTIKEYYHTLSDWHTEILTNRALALHGYLIHGEPPVCTCRDKRHEIEWDNYVLECDVPKRGQHATLIPKHRRK